MTTIPIIISTITYINTIIMIITANEVFILIFIFNLHSFGRNLLKTSFLLQFYLSERICTNALIKNKNKNVKNKIKFFCFYEIKTINIINITIDNNIIKHIARLPAFL